MSISRTLGIGLDGSTVTVTIGKTTIPIVSAKYGETVSQSKIAYMGSQQTAEVSPGYYEADVAELEITALIFRSVFMPTMATNGFANKEFSMVVNRSHPDIGSDSDLLEGCRVNKIAASTANTSDLEKTTVSFTVRQIRWTEARKTTDRLDGVAQGENTI